SGLEGVDAVINLCGVNVGDKRWSGSFKQSLRDSRIGPTEVIAAAVADAGVPTLINASAVGYYGNTGSRVVDETAPAGGGFLSRLCLDWEAAALAAEDAGARVVLARSGLVLSPGGGVLARLRPLFSLGLGARIGNGRQYMPWISLEDEIRALLFAINNDDLSGPVNFTGPAPVTNSEFTAALGRALNRPTPLMVPGFALRTLLGEFADEGLLDGQRAIPAALERAGFVFHHNTIGEALAYATTSAQG
ncbi:MAG: TIGR01777 family protein, partial [Mycolicibacterium aromaticivorans]|nr:TIGR01777 family protein [Mycolicibacterium aromaticivorans]